MISLKQIHIRTATKADIPDLMDLQNSYVKAGFIGMLKDRPFELEERKQWFSQFSETTPYQLHVATDGDKLFGYTASFQYRGGGVFSKTIETSIYSSLENASKGTGSLLYESLFQNLSNFDLHLAVVGIALPNDRSISLHRKFGFEDVGIFKEYAYFKGSYVSSLWMQKQL
jgi:phosphinothricin acetyltransferase